MDRCFTNNEKKEKEDEVTWGKSSLFSVLEKDEEWQPIINDSSLFACLLKSIRKNDEQKGASQMLESIRS